MANMQSMNRTEALRLADALSQGRYLTTDAGNPIAEAAAELRRLHARIAELEAKASENYWLLYAMKEQELWYQDELVEEAKRTAAEKLRADQMTEQHRMEAAMNAEARGALAQLREKRQLLNPQYSSADPADALDARLSLLTAIEDSGEGLRYEMNCLVINGVNTFNVYDGQTEEFISGNWNTDPIAAIDAALFATTQGNTGQEREKQ